MKTITVAGLDPSLSNFGMVKGSLDLESGILTVTQIQLIETKPESKNKTVRKNSIDLERSRKLYKELTEFIKDVDLVCVEIPVGSQSARAMTSYGICIGLLASIDLPLIQVTPTEVKLAATNSKTASKAEMINWAVLNYPEAQWLTVTRKGITNFVDKNEHMADALAAIVAGVQTDIFKQLRMFHLKN